jgi:hypothetical protein
MARTPVRGRVAASREPALLSRLRPTRDRARNEAETAAAEATRRLDRLQTPIPNTQHPRPHEHPLC